MMVRNAKIIVITSLKGGVGKTTTILALAGIYSNMNKKVLIIDMDLNAGAIDTTLNITCHKNIYDFNQDLVNHKSINIEEYINKYSPNISFIASTHDPRLSSEFNLSYLKAMFGFLDTMYDVILVDTNHIISPLNIALYDLADTNLFMLTNDPICITNTKTMIELSKKYDINNYKVVLNESIMPNRKYFDKLDIRSILGKNIDYTIPSDLNMPNIDNYIMAGKIMTIDKNFIKYHRHSIKNLNKLANSLMEGK